jgi:hypothetical protein
MNWADFAAEAPGLAALAGERFQRHGLVLVVTLTKDGSPRLSPVEPLIVDGNLMLGMMWQSRKALDLLRDPRVLVHNVITNKDGTEGEIKIRGRAIDVLDQHQRQRYGEQLLKKIGWKPDEPYHLFSVDVENVSFVQSGEQGQRVVLWRRGGRERSRVRKWTGSGYAD